MINTIYSQSIDSRSKEGEAREEQGRKRESCVCMHVSLHVYVTDSREEAARQSCAPQRACLCLSFPLFLLLLLLQLLHLLIWLPGHLHT